jgi:hypothetical protein
MIISVEVHRQAQGKRVDLIRFHGILPLGEVGVLLALPRRLQLLLMLQNNRDRQEISKPRSNAGRW